MIETAMEKYDPKLLEMALSSFARDNCRVEVASDVISAIWAAADCRYGCPYKMWWFEVEDHTWPTMTTLNSNYSLQFEPFEKKIPFLGEITIFSYTGNSV